MLLVSSTGSTGALSANSDMLEISLDLYTIHNVIFNEPISKMSRFRIVKLGVQELFSLCLLSSSTKGKVSRSPLDPWSLKLSLQCHHHPPTTTTNTRTYTRSAPRLTHKDANDPFAATNTTAATRKNAAKDSV